MTIHHFAVDQNDVFVPALCAVLAATILIVLPVVFAPAVRRARGGRAAAALGAVLAVVALVLAAWQAGVGMRTLEQERAQVGSALRSGYGYRLDDGQVASLVDGDPITVDGSRLRLHRQADGTIALLVDGREQQPQG